MKNYVKLTIALFLLLNIYSTMAQEAISPSGGNISSTSGSVSYTIGQSLYSLISDDSGSLAQGVQQPYEIYVITGNDNINSTRLTCSVFPNPASDFLSLVTDNEREKPLVGSLYDISGKNILQIAIESRETIIPIGTLPSSTYILKISTNGIEIKTFKIVKNN